MLGYFIDDFINLPNGDAFVAVRLGDNYRTPPIYVRVARSTLDDYDQFREVLMRDHGLPFSYYKPQHWSDYIALHEIEAGQSPTAWGRMPTEVSLNV